MKHFAYVSWGYPKFMFHRMSVVFSPRTDFTICSNFICQLCHFWKIIIRKYLLNIFLSCPMGTVMFDGNNFPLFIFIKNVLDKIFAVPKFSSGKVSNQFMLNTFGLITDFTSFSNVSLLVKSIICRVFSVKTIKFLLSRKFASRRTIWFLKQLTGFSVDSMV